MASKSSSLAPASAAKQLKISNQWFKVVPIDGKELGCVACRDIPKGTLIIEEEPIFIFDVPLQSYLFQRSSSSNTNSLKSTSESTTTYLLPEKSEDLHSALNIHLNDQIEFLLSIKPQEKQGEFWGLANSHPELPEGFAIFQTNAISTTPDCGGMFPIFSRFNSTCRPNLGRPVWNKLAKKIEGRVNRDVLKGEEIGWMYLDNVYDNSMTRAAEVKQVLGFDCGCSACSATINEKKLSDRRIDRLRELKLVGVSFEKNQARVQLEEGKLTEGEKEVVTGESNADKKIRLEEMLELARMEGLGDLIDLLEEDLAKVSVTEEQTLGAKGM